MPLLYEAKKTMDMRAGAPVGALIAVRPHPDPYLDPVFRAIVDLTAERGYEAVRIGMIARRAGIAEPEIEARLGDRQSCMLAALSAYMEDYVWRIEAAYRTGADWREGIRAAGWAITDLLVHEPNIVRVVAVELMATRSEMLRVAREEVLMYGARVIERGRAECADPTSVPAGAAAMAMGSAAQLVTNRLQKGLPLEATEMVRDLIYLAVRPFLGEEAALEELSMPRPAGSRLPLPGRPRAEVAPMRVAG
jgi:AcrR family transcriptional regulator